MHSHLFSAVLLQFCILFNLNFTGSCSRLACRTLAPNATIHGKPKSLDTIPFEFMSVVHYHDSKFDDYAIAMITYKVYIRPKKGDQFKNEKFRGFILQAQDINGNPIGNFITDGRNHAKHLDCHDSVQATLINANFQPKTSLGFYWIAPVDFNPEEEKVFFTGSIVKDKNTYWMNVKSSAENSKKLSILIFALIIIINSCI